MYFDNFIGEIQHRLELAKEGEAVRATRAVLTTLGERIGEGEASDLAGPLPMEIDRYLTDVGEAEQFSFQEFIDRVSERARVEEADAFFYSQAVIALVDECVPEGELQDIQEQLPDEFDELFEFVNQTPEATPW